METKEFLQAIYLDENRFRELEGAAEHILRPWRQVNGSTGTWYRRYDLVGEIGAHAILGTHQEKLQVDQGLTNQGYLIMGENRHLNKFPHGCPLCGGTDKIGDEMCPLHDEGYFETTRG